MRFPYSFAGALVPARLLALLLAAVPLAARAQTGGVGVGTTTPRAGLDVDHIDGILATGTEGSGTIPLEGVGTRLLWYPAKGAFRAGTVGGYTDGNSPVIQGLDAWDDVNIGLRSTAFGYGCRASGEASFATGYGCTASGQRSMAVGEACTASGPASIALGYHANTNVRQGAFVFSDRSTIDLFTAGINHTSNWRVSGGFRIFTSSNLSTGITIQSGTVASNWGQNSAVISTSNGAMLTTSGVWQNASDRNRKHRFEAVAGEDVLTRLRRLPLTRWSYKVDKPGVRHLGPMAQDFYRIFGLGQDSLSIGTVDADGVALVAAQALDARTRHQAGQLARLQAENQALRRRLDALEQHATGPATAALPWLGGLLLLGFGAQALRRRPARG